MPHGVVGIKNQIMADWTNHELELIVQDYFEMLKFEINGKGHFNVLEC